MNCALARVGESAALRDEFVECSAFDDPALIEHQNLVRVADGREAVRDDERRAAAHRRVDRFLNLAFGFGVERARRLVENHDRRILEERAGDRQALSLAARQVAASFADHGLKAVRRAVDEFARLGLLERKLHLGRGRVGLADAQILLDRAREDERLLEHDPDVVPERLGG